MLLKQYPFNLFSKLPLAFVRQDNAEINSYKECNGLFIQASMQLNLKVDKLFIQFPRSL